jgi:hypothetical protein
VPPDQGRRGLCEKAADACHDAAAANPIDYTPIVQRDVNPKLKIPLRFELMTGIVRRYSFAGKHRPAMRPEPMRSDDMRHA